MITPSIPGLSFIDRSFASEKERGSGSVRMLTSILIFGNSFLERGLNLGSWRAALIALILTPSIRDSWGMICPMHPRKAPSIVRVTKVPRLSNYLVDSRDGDGSFAFLSKRASWIVFLGT